MSNKYKILELLKEQELTIKEITDKTKFNENEVRTYIHRLLEDNLIKDIGKKNRWIIYTAIEKTPNNIDTYILKKILPKFIELEVKLENTTEREDKRIMELIKECQLI